MGISSINRRSSMILFSGNTDIFSHQVRLVLAEKGINFELEDVDINNLPKELVNLNPYGKIPTLVDRNLTLYESRIIMEYLDERFPHPPLMPVYPVVRGTSRLMMYSIEKDWYSLMYKIKNGQDNEIEEVRKELKDELLSMAPVFKEAPFFMSEEFSLVDCYIAPLLWRLPTLGIELSKEDSKEIICYMNRIFERNTFINSLTNEECAMRT